MKRWLGWTVVAGLGGALVTGCFAQEREESRQGVRPQEVPRERRPAPFGVGPGADSAREMAQEQLKTD
jgi:hypothetical protein